MERGGIGLQEFIDDREITSNDQADCSDRNGPGIYAQHHLVLINVGSAELLIDLVLPLRSERVATNVHGHEDQPNNLCAIVTVRGLAGKRKYGHTHCNEERLHILTKGIDRPFQVFPHQHDGNNFGRFKDRLDRKGHVFQGSILRPTAQGVAQGARSKAYHRCGVVGKNSAVFESACDGTNNDRQKSIRKDTKCRRRKSSVWYIFGRVEHGGHD